MSSLLDVFSQVEVEPERGEGCWVVAAGGQRFLDLYGGHAVTVLGHGHPRLVSALDDQQRALLFQSNLFPLDVRRRAATRLASAAPEGLTQVFFVNSGAEANENALRISFLATGRREVVAVEGAFHGRTAAAAAVTAGSERWYAFPSPPFPVRWVPFDDPVALDRAVTDDTAAVILEPVQGMAGARAFSRETLEVARRVTRDRGATLVFDEVQCGVGRTGWFFAAQAFGVTPDILTTAKGIAGGFPAGAVLVSAECAASVKRGDLGTTFGGGPAACAMIEATIDAIECDALLPRVRRISEQIRTTCVVGPVTSIQGLGFILGFRTRRLAKEVLAELRQRGILAGASADDHVIRLLPPLVLEEGHVDLFRRALEEIPA